MRLVTIASTIVLGLVAGLSQASDWRENPFAAQIDRTDLGHPSNPSKERALRGVTYKTGHDTSYTSYEIGPALGPDLRNNTYTAPGAQSGRFIVRAAFRF